VNNADVDLGARVDELPDLVQLERPDELSDVRRVALLELDEDGCAHLL
jgi:hypothetical protein